MSIYNLEKIFRPTSIAVVGASKKKGSLGHALLKNLQRGGYEGRVFPVNPNYRKIEGLPAYPSIAHIKQPLDLALIATPMFKVPSVIKECAEAEVGGTIIISAGGKETGDEGRNIEGEIKKEADKKGVRIIGPNCAGIIVPGAKLYASFVSKMPQPGNMAFISQSGAMCAAIIDFSLKEHIGFSHFVSIGSMLDIDFGDLIDYLGNDPEVRSIVLYIESVANARKFMSAARTVSQLKPIVVLKAGKSSAGARAAASHTGAIAGEDAIYDAAFKRAGIVRVNTIGELFDCAELMAKQPRPKGPNLAIVTNAGGPGVMAADALSSFGLEPVFLRPETMKQLDDVLPPFWSRGNPIDILGDATPERYRQVVDLCMRASEISGLLIILTPQAMTDPTSVAASLTEVLQNKRISVFTVWMGAGDVEKGREIFNRAGIPTYETPEQAVKAFTYMSSYDRNLELLQETPPKLDRGLEFDRTNAEEIVREALDQGKELLTEVKSKALVAAYGIPVNRTEVATSEDEAVDLAQDMGFPVAMKINSRDIIHKSDAHGVQLNLHDKEAVREAFSTVLSNAHAYNPQAEILGVSIQPMLPRPDYELILGCKKDADFGPVILFGMGGIMTEILKDQDIALPPLNRLLARRLIERTRVYKLLKGYRNRPPANLEVLEEILIRLSQLVTDFPQITELDINPLIFSEDKAYALDARVIVRHSPTPSPLHLAISPYPNHYEVTTTTKGGLEIFIRPIKPEDEPLLVELFHALSQESIYFRFFTPLRSLSHKTLAYLTQIDYARDVVLVALEKKEEDERILGVCRLTRIPGTARAEAAVVVGDPWQGKGIAAELFERCIAIAKERGLESLWGLVLVENTTTLTLARKLGFTITRSADYKEYEVRMDLRAMNAWSLGPPV
jgi:acetyltransferase